ncbi:MAG: alpha-amylase, partial [Bacteroidales bacterium]|nr:alpha-amylase [Bacteroidales bacterium]
VKAQFPDSVENEELNALLLTINNQALEIKELQTRLKTVIDKNVEELVKPAKKEVKNNSKKEVKSSTKTVAKKEVKKD